MAEKITFTHEGIGQVNQTCLIDEPTLCASCESEMVRNDTAYPTEISAGRFTLVCSRDCQRDLLDE